MFFCLLVVLFGVVFFCLVLLVVVCDWVVLNVMFGCGVQVYQFVFVDLVIGCVMFNVCYCLFLFDYIIVGKLLQVGEIDSVIFGMIDSVGCMVKVWLLKCYVVVCWVFNLVVGYGEFGELFCLVDLFGGVLIEGYLYLVDVVGEYLFCGCFSVGGYIVYV